MLNSDGLRHDQANSNFWRKNRNPASARPSQPLSAGVDVNRNFDLLWDFPKRFNSTVAPASTNPASQAFYGTAPFPEPETSDMDMAWVYDEYPNIHWYIDVHPAAGTLLYSWGDDKNQSHGPTQSLLTPSMMASAVSSKTPSTANISTKKTGTTYASPRTAPRMLWLLSEAANMCLSKLLVCILRVKRAMTGVAAAGVKIKR
jgi:hypothetical protein